MESLAVIVPTHVGHQPWLKACLESYRKLNHFVLVVYDNPFVKHKDVNRALPQPDVMELADVTLIRPPIFRRSVSFSHFWNMVHGLRLLKEMGYKYVFNINGDCVLEKPEGFEDIVDWGVGYDINTLQYEPNRRYVGTMAWIAQTDLMLDFYDNFLESCYMHLGNTEGRLWRYVTDNGLSVAPVKNSFANFRLPDWECDWVKTLGLRHLHAEHKVRQGLDLQPVERHLIDYGPNNMYVGNFFMETVDKYWETGDKKYLKTWWRKGGDGGNWRPLLKHFR